RPVETERVVVLVGDVSGDVATAGREGVPEVDVRRERYPAGRADGEQLGLRRAGAEQIVLVPGRQPQVDRERPSALALSAQAVLGAHQYVADARRGAAVREHARERIVVEEVERDRLVRS